MCLILDTNKYGDFLNQNNPDMEPVRKWLEKGGKIAYAPTQTMKSELNKHEKMRQKFYDYDEAGKLKQPPKEEVEKAMERLQKLDLKSDDPHIIALAQVSGVKLLVSGDKALHADFKELIKGKIYQTKKHQNLLKPDLCP